MIVPPSLVKGSEVTKVSEWRPFFLVSISIEIPLSLKEPFMIKLSRDRINPVTRLMFHEHKILFTNPSRGILQTISLLEFHVQGDMKAPPEGGVIDNGVRRTISIL
jgi:hypothetical protein